MEIQIRGQTWANREIDLLSALGQILFVCFLAQMWIFPRKMRIFQENVMCQEREIRSEFDDKAWEREREK